MVQLLITTYQRIQKIESFYKAIDKEILSFKNKLGIECQLHCSKCCEYKDIRANPTEFLPFAYHAYKLGLLDEWFSRISSQENSECIFHRKINGNWGCQIYPVRGLICRTFGFSAIIDRIGSPVLASCSIIKALRPELKEKLASIYDKKKKIPVISSFYKRLEAIDPASGNISLPINQAVQKAIEKVYFSVQLKYK